MYFPKVPFIFMCLLAIFSRIPLMCMPFFNLLIVFLSSHLFFFALIGSCSKFCPEHNYYENIKSFCYQNKLHRSHASL
uniref:Uncharacterized protein n=1 Tax=Arundo donax TaxID=35708 RepID=A0A0A9FD49_ARUDO